MNLSRLFELQRQLDEHIEKEHPREPGEDRLAKKILALMVELGELANELPKVFEFWSNKKNNRKKALEEFCDALHFTLSIGNEIGANELYERTEPVMSFKPNIIEQFMALCDYIPMFYRSRHTDVAINTYDFVISHLLGLGDMLGFSWEEIEKAYLWKNRENHQRQESGY